jgi:uncharacterized membrane protein
VRVPKFSTITICILIWLGVVIITSFLAVDKHRAFWGSHERMTGTFTLIHYIIFYFIIITLIKSKNELQHILSLIQGIGIIIIITGIIQKYISIDFLYIFQNERPDSFLGNPIYFGGFAVLLIFIFQIPEAPYWHLL